jgi:ubiquinone/menaquinone biosynthesis C-methylase UbiE
MKEKEYVHGYSEIESRRLSDQACTLNSLLHYDSIFKPTGLILEAGCGTGAQTVIIAPQNPDCNFISVDISDDSLAEARKRIERENIQNVSFRQADIFNLPFADEAFDHIFICFVLEHLEKPVQALASLKRVLKKSGTITVIEGDHGSAYYHPQSDAAQATIRCLIELQERMGGNSLIGRKLYPLLVEAGFDEVQVSPRLVYADASRPEMVDGFTNKTFIAMVEGVKKQVIAGGLMTEEDWNRGIADLKRSAGVDGTFNYTFFKATGVKP